MKRVGVLLGAILGAVAASACCILPALLGIAGASTLGLGSALAPYRPYLMALTLVLLGLGFYFTYRPAPAEECPDEGCHPESTRSKRFSRALLWVVTVLTLGVILYPWAAAYRADPIVSASSAAPASASLQTVTFAVGQMTCAECTTEIRKTLKKTPGVYEATVDFKGKRTEVRFDPSRVSVAKLKSVIDQLGFSATEVKAASTKEQARQSSGSIPLITLASDTLPLQNAFNRDVSRTRVLLLVSPT